MFINAELDMCFGYGWNGGPEFNTRVVTTKSWVERRNAQNIECRHSYSLPLANIKQRSYLVLLKQTFMACRGMLHSFKIKDYSDFEADGEVFGLGDGSTTVFQLRKDSTFGIATYTRFITKPNDGVVVKVNGTPTTVLIDTLTGLVTFPSAPANDAIITWTGEFRVPVRFNSDILSNSIDNLFGDGDYAMSGSIDLIEVFKE
jgi:uncharacterized protein (TIGR02217 family)